MEQKLGNFQEKCDQWHFEHGPERKHWFIHMVGVVPDHQGQGMGKELMAKLNDMADKMNQAMYLEAGERNRRFYEKMRFVVQHTVTLEDSDGVENSIKRQCVESIERAREASATDHIQPRNDQSFNITSSKSG
ncbi:unknown protein [Seminavis robusta]|uniref:N-acetyltransferase domain-containing protein n=1 Tax=Seminavis robusta TaxID=568900 RepID=A0A9N8F216_9STRA|nr:unknown protein [Seminavis robusta]|eukprot:Sro2417_g326960.1 n/a (133) ;mRNA; r:7948-8346